MSESGFPIPVSEVMATLAEIFHYQKAGDIVELVEHAHADFDEIDYDNWNGGTYTWALRLAVPIPIYASIEPRSSEIEKEITKKLKYVARLHPNHSIGEVRISPVAHGASVVGQKMTLSVNDVRHIWTEGRFRLFLSHVSKCKVEVSKLKEELAWRGVAGFVAHEDITPSLEWLREIELGLRSMHALAALLTPDFHASHWTDQEIGWALGRGVPVVPVRLGIDPYGFVGKYQGIPGTLDKPNELASAIVETLLNNTQTHPGMRRALVAAFVDSGSFRIATELCKLVVKIMDFTEEEKKSLRQACIENDQVDGAYNVSQRIYNAVGMPPEAKPIIDDGKHLF